MVLANNMLKGQADGYCQNSFPLHQRKIELVLPAAFAESFRGNFPCGFAVENFHEKECGGNPNSI